MDQEAKYFNALNIALQSNYSELKKNFEQFGSWGGAWEKLKSNHNVSVDAEWEKLRRHEIQLILQGDKNFPSALKEILWPPLGIFVKGNLDLFSRSTSPAVGIVGTRKATTQGKELARKIAKGLAQHQVTIVSGLALGIDESAHWGAIEANGGTISVLALGLDQVYPRQNIHLARKILELGGCLISEYPIGSSSFPSRFIERNRIISGLGLGIVVIEAPEDSGALATARFALEQNREVFVMPGFSEHYNYAGSHKLLREGARLVTSVEDILEDLNLKEDSENVSLPLENAKNLNLDEGQSKVVTVLRSAGKPLEVDEISQLLKIESSLASRSLSFLLLKGIIKEGGGKYYL